MYIIEQIDFIKVGGKKSLSEFAEVGVSAEQRGQRREAAGKKHHRQSTSHLLKESFWEASWGL